MLAFGLISFDRLAPQDYSVNFYLRQFWYDPRLRWELKPPYDHLDKVNFGSEHFDRVWLPDTFFRNEKKAKIHDVTVPNKMLRLHNDGKMFYITKSVLRNN